MIAITFLLILLIIGVIKYCLHMRTMESYVKNVPSIPCSYLPFIGHGHAYIGKTSEAFFNLYRQFVEKVETPSKFYLGPFLVINLDKPEDVKTVLMSSSCLDRPYFYQFLPNTTGLFTIKSGTEWKPIRKIMNTTFNSKILQSFIPIFYDKTKMLLENLDREVGKCSFDVFKYTSNFTLDTICATTMGYDVNAQQGKNLQYLESVQAIEEIITIRGQKFWMHTDFVYHLTSLYQKQIKHYGVMRAMTEKVSTIKKKEYLEKIKSNISSNNTKDDATVSYKSPQLTIDQLNRFYFEGKFSDKVVKDQIEIIIGAGFDSSSLTLAFTVLLLAMHPDIQEKLFNELLCCDEQNENETNEKLQQLTYLDCVIKESMRLFPVGSFLARTTTADIQLKSFTIPKGAFVSVSIFNMHRRTDLWGDDANEFNPEHFLPENSKDRHPFQFIPFGAGIRNCIGFQYATILMKIALAAMVRRYKFSTNLKLSDLKLTFEVTLKLLNKYMVQIEKRG